MNSTEQLLCGNCDNPIEEHFNYCPNCGEKINMEVENEYYERLKKFVAELEKQGLLIKLGEGIIKSFIKKYKMEKHNGTITINLAKQYF